MTGAIVHEWIESTGGAEKVLDGFFRAFPDADTFVSWNDEPDRWDRHIRQSWIARTPLRRRKAIAALALLPSWRYLHSSTEYDFMLVSSHLFAHHARLVNQPRVPKFVYAHTPARYVWSPELDSRGASSGVRALSPLLKHLDRRRANEAVSVAANSKYVANRIERFWHRDAEIIYPPVDVAMIRSQLDWSEKLTGPERDLIDRLPETFVLAASRFIPYKRLDLAIGAASRAGVPIVVAGRGPEEDRLRSLAADSRVPVDFVIAPSNTLLFALYQRAQAYVFPAIEDFGIMPVEAIAAGCPVIALNSGGAGESVENGLSGITVESQKTELFAEAIENITKIDRSSIAHRAERFDTREFVGRVREWVGAHRR